MARLGEAFNPAEVPEDDRNFDPVPAGDYVCQVIDSDVVVKDNGNEMLKLTLEIMSGPYESRRVFDNLNYRHSNPQAQAIAQRSLADLCTSIGINAGLRETDDLHFKPFVASIKIDPAKGEYGPQNRVRRYRPMAGQAPAQAPRTGHAAPPPAARTASTGNRPWQR